MNESWVQILTIVLSNLGIILWFRKESREDWVRCQNTIDSIREEMVDFHKELIRIENERNKR